MTKIFTPAKAAAYTYVFNCGGETRYSQEDSVYALRSVALTKTLAAECARRRIPAYVELSTGMVYKAPSSSAIAAGGCAETAALKPWLRLAKHKLAAEEALEAIRREHADGKVAAAAGELRYAVLRLAHVYGEYDAGYLSRGLCLARVYQAKAEEMRWLYGRELRVNTVHARDVASACWRAAAWAALTAADDPEVKPENGGRVFNIADDGDTRQADMANILGRLFAIDTGFQSGVVNMFAKLNLDSVVDDVNDDVLQPWADLLAEKGITRPGPIGPFMEKELLKDCDLCLNAGRAKKVLGWEIAAGREKIGDEGVRAVIESYKRMGWWP